ncbi:sulfurtransferase complex subunit TusB [bacterium]|nr:MAG: sulfurtransferase complex subunit TusB [bacterium]
MKTLYIISHSPFQRTDYRLALELADKEDAVLLIQNGVYLSGKLTGCPEEALAEAEKRGVKFFSIKEDIDARGIESRYPTVDYSGAIELIFKYERTV